MPQKETVLKHLEIYGSLTTIEASQKYYITSLRDVVYKIRVDFGYEYINSTKLYNKRTKTNYVKYTLGV